MQKDDVSETRIDSVKKIEDKKYKTEWRLLYLLYPSRSASSGSTFAAFHAGRQQASSATKMSSNAMTVKINGSVPSTP